MDWKEIIAIMITNTDYEKFFPDILALRSLSSGGQRSVFLGQHIKYGRIVLKICERMTNHARILRELEIIKNNNFPSVPKLYETNSRNIDGVSVLYSIEEYIDGENLRDILNKQHFFSYHDVIDFMNKILQTIVELEEKKIIHRDIKPENIVRDRTGNYWLLDFGIARDLNAFSLTATTDDFGPFTPGYAAPEQINNSKRQLDSRADLFSIGMVAYEMLAGYNPIIKDSKGVLNVIQRTENVRLPDFERSDKINPELLLFIETLAKSSPVMRPPTAKIAYNWFKEIIK